MKGLKGRKKRNRYLGDAGLLLYSAYKVVMENLKAALIYSWMPSIGNRYRHS